MILTLRFHKTEVKLYLSGPRIDKILELERLIEILGTPNSVFIYSHLKFNATYENSKKRKNVTTRQNDTKTDRQKDRATEARKTERQKLER